MNQRERVECLIRGQKPDRIPVLFSSHFPVEVTKGEAAVRSHVEYFRESGNDFCKVMNENQQRGVSTVCAPADLASIRLSDASRMGMRDQASIVAGVREQLGPDVPVLCTVHGPMVSVHHMSGRKGFFVENLDFYHKCVKEDPVSLKAALRTATDGLCELVRRVSEAGADGIYLACLGAQRSLFTDEEYASIVRPFDLEVLSAAKELPFNIVHICAQDLAVERFADYPVPVVNWEFGGANMTMEEGFSTFGDKILLGGMDHHHGALVEGNGESLEEEVRGVLNRASGHRFILGAGCTLPGSTELSRLRRVAEICGRYGA